MRGFGDTSYGRVLILVNGERLNTPDMAAPNLMRIPVQSVKRIEIIRGAQTVLYGDYAEAGVINIITDTSVEAKPEMTVSASAGSYDTYATHFGRTGTFDDGVTYRANADWERSSGYRANGDYEIWGVNAAVKKAWNENRYVTLSTFYNDTEYGLPGALSWQEYQTSPRITKDPKNRAWTKNWGLNIGGRTTVGTDGYLEANLTASRRDTDARYKGGAYRESTIDSYALTPRYVLDTDIEGHENRLVVGTDMRYDPCSMNDTGTRWHYDRTSSAGYAQDEFFITEKLSVTVGARAERIFNRITQNNDPDSRDGNESAYDAALMYRPQDDVKLFARVARFYHAPFADEVAYTLPNADLVPETGYSYDAGTEVTFAKEWTAAVTAYQIDMQNEIYFDPQANGWGSNINAPGSTRRRGVETSLRWSREQTGSIGLFYDYVDARFTEGTYEDNEVPLVPHHALTVNGEVYVASGLALLGTVHSVSSQYLGSDFNNTETKLDPYATVDFAVRYEPAILKRMTLLAGVDNVFDEQYANYGGTSPWLGNYYYPAVGRTWKVSASYSF
jgi:iron complex outermembrane receptor protein